MTSIFAPRVFDGEAFLPASTVEISGNRIVAIAPGSAVGADIVLPDGATLAPGYVDLQVNGGGGALLNDGIDLATVGRIAAAHASAGTTSLLPTLISGTRPMIRQALQIAAEACAEIAGVLGLHVEGPFLSTARAGIHPPDHLIPMTDEDEAMLGAFKAGHLLLTVAPEIVGTARIAALRDAGISVFVGHTDATAHQAIAAFDAGAVGCTHLFNAMSQLGSRAPGVVGAALAHHGAMAGLICDGLHVDPVAVRAAYHAMGPRRLFFVSDAMPTAASDTTSWVWQGETIRLDGDRLARADGTLAGAHVTMADCVRRAVTLCGITPLDALRMATTTPARAIDATEAGRLAVGGAADMIVLDDTFCVRSVWQAGRPLAVAGQPAPA